MKITLFIKETFKNYDKMLSLVYPKVLESQKVMSECILHLFSSLRLSGKSNDLFFIDTLQQFNTNTKNNKNFINDTDIQ